ncbi:hypothetical protein KJ925_00960 [Patescibacteria group bacterium]|nr:hypothetical protein [Patescibacteria group bacterium]
MEKVKTIIIAVLSTIIVAGLAFYLIRSQKEDATPTQTPEPVAEEQPTPEPVQLPPALELTEMFSETDAGYTMGYPKDWTYEVQGEGFRTVIFNGASGTEAYRATVNIQTIPSKENGGTFATVQEVMDDLKAQIEKDESGKVLDEQELAYTTESKEQLSGIQIAAEYALEGEVFQQWQIVVPRADGKAFNTIAYTAPASIFLAFQPTAQSMIQTWAMVE